MTTVSNLRAYYDGPPASSQSQSQSHSQSQRQQQAARHAALRGAQLAFPRPSPQPAVQKHENSSAGTTNAASLAAGRRAQATAPLPPPPSDPTPASSASLGAVRAHLRSREALHLEPHRWSISGDSSLQKPPRSESPSNIAAVLATARLSPQTTHLPKPNRILPNGPHRSHLRPLTPEQVPEEEQIPQQGTVHQVQTWLQTIGASEQSPRQAANVHTPADEGISPTHIPSRPHLSLDTTLPQATVSRPATHVVQTPEIVSPKPVRSISVTESLEAKSKRASAAAASLSQPHDLLQQTLHSSRTRPRGGTSPSMFYDAEESLALPAHPLRADGHVELLPSPEPPGRGPEAPRSRRSEQPQDIDDKLQVHHTSDLTQPRQPQQDALPPVPGLSIPRRSRLEPQQVHAGPPIVARKVTPHLTGDSLANAIVAGSLASSRAPSPTKSPGPGFHAKAADRRRLSIPFMSREAGGDFRTPSPAKGMRQTMRRRASSTSGDEEKSPRKASRKFLIRKHPHKHHEGDRKRWRDELTARERKRYEGLWAANRGAYVPESAPGASEKVAGVVVRDIWRRSRLPDPVLEEVWELVDTAKSGWLGRAEFVVGLWLVDQRLKGRKLPVRVQSTVWQSARGIHGLKIKRVK